MVLHRTPPPSPYDHLPAVPSFVVSSEDLADGGVLPLLHVHESAGGGNTSPQLSWSGHPAAARSFAVTCFDPDAPTASGWWHWLLADLPAEVMSLPRGAGAADGSGLPPAVVQYRTDYGSHGYQGAAPPHGDHDHRYFFVVHALDVPSLGLPPDTPAAVVGFHLNAHALARAVLVATYKH